MTECKIDGCQRDDIRPTTGWCKMHHRRWYKHGHPLSKMRPFSDVLPFLDKLLAAPKVAECIIWPFSSLHDGYGYYTRKGKRTLAHVHLCTAAHGPRPRKHESAHRCGIRSCVNPHHLYWATLQQNQSDRIKHGTWGLKLSECDVRNIRIEYAKGDISQEALANFFDVSRSLVWQIVNGKTWFYGGAIP